MKKCFLVLFFLLFLVACSESGSTGNDQTGKKEEQIVWNEIESVSFDDAIKQATEDHISSQTADIDMDEFSRYFQNDQNDENVLAQNDIELLKQERNTSTNGDITTSAAISDIDLFFNALKYGYGAYYYYGGDETFNKLREKAISQVKENYSEKLSKQQLADILTDLFMDYPDMHRVIGDNFWANYPEYHSKYYYDLDHVFSKDDKGYYKQLGDEKYYFDHFQKSDGFIGLTLLENGDIVYCPVQFVKPEKYVESDKLVLKGIDGEEISEDVKWINCIPYSKASIPEPNAAFIQKSGITYVAIRSFDTNKREEIEETFVAHAREAIGSKAIIIDIRSNSGGGEEFAEEWIKEYSSSSVSDNRVTASKKTLFDSDRYDGFLMFKSDADIIDNGTPTFVLVDENVGSAGELTVKYLEIMKNVIIVGSNTNGCQICGNQMKLTLPNTGLPIRFGKNLMFCCELTSVESVGYKPDIWCDPQRSLSNVLQLLKNNNYISDQDAEDLLKSIENTFIDEIKNPEVNSSDVSIDEKVYLCENSSGNGNKILPGDGFGNSPNKPYKVYVFEDGEMVSDFDVVSNSSNLKIKIDKMEKGSLEITASAEGDYPFTIKINGNSYEFRYRS